MLDQFGLNKEDFPTYREYKRVYDRHRRQTDARKDYLRAYNKLYRLTDAFKESKQKYNNSDKGKQTVLDYCQSEARKLAMQRYNKSATGKLSKQKYSRSEKGKARALAYNHSEKGKATRSKYIQENKGIFTAKTAKYRASKIQRTPLWSETEAIKQFYLNCPKGMVVDHIIPLQGTEVSGLHVLENLQYLTPKENASKGNKLLDEYR